MREVLITSGVLILIITALRTLLRGKISLRLQYGLWLLVAVRLLVPVSLAQSPMSVMNAVARVEQAAENVAPPAAPGVPGVSGPTEGMGADVSAGTSTVLPAAPTAPTALKAPANARQIARVVWLGGIGIMAAWFFVADLRFRRRLSHNKKPLENPNCPLPVYVTEAVPSPCLYGLWRPAVYLTPDCLEDDAGLGHILAHETTHYRHGDHIWSLARCVCLAVYWFNPLVWLAAALSRRDCELACDEGAIRRLGEGERIPYGRTLLGMVVPKSAPADLLRTATTMTSGRGGLRERVALIARKPKAMLAAAIAVALIAAVAVGCTFTGAQGSKKPDMPIGEALTVLPEEWKDKVVLKEDGECWTGELLAAYYHKEDLDTDYGGWMFSVGRLTQVELEQNYYGYDMSGGAAYLGRDETGYYVLYSPTDVRTGHYESYGPASEALRAWVEELFARYEDITPMEEDPVYQALSGPYSYESPHINVLYKPYYGLTNYGAARNDTEYTFLLSQQAEQGESGIWCVDRWYDASGTAYLWLPETDVTLAEYYADLQAKADKGEADWAKDPLQVSMAFAKEELGHERVPEAFTVGEVYEGTPRIDMTAVTIEEGVKRRLREVLADGAMIALPGDDGVTLSIRKLPFEPQATNRQDYAVPIAEGSDWKDMAEPAYFNGGTLEPEEYDWTVRLYNEHAGEFTFYQGSDIIRYYDISTGTSWYEATSPEKSGSLADMLRHYYDYTEFAAYTEAQVIGATGSFEQVARMYAEAVAQGIKNLSIGSEYAVEDAKVYKAEVYDTIEGDDTQFCFTMLLALKKADIGLSGGYQAGAGTTPIEEPGFEDYHSWGMQVALRREGGTWTCFSSGSGGVWLEKNS